MNLFPLARFFVIIGLIFLFIGGLLYLAARLGFPLFDLPGDIRIERENFSCMFALGTSILLSILLTVAINLIARFLNR
ncbi:MAG TPA: DUF2905 domain-containing protein [Anaerolineales bacterium]|nr:DUF2905 domain-containing protein [Anaerolineales bacterium]